MLVSGGLQVPKLRIPQIGGTRWLRPEQCHSPKPTRRLSSREEGKYVATLCHSHHCCSHLTMVPTRPLLTPTTLLCCHPLSTSPYLCSINITSQHMVAEKRDANRNQHAQTTPTRELKNLFAKAFTDVFQNRCLKIAPFY